VHYGWVGKSWQSSWTQTGACFEFCPSTRCLSQIDICQL
jgi:hypothetical protein